VLISAVSILHTVWLIARSLFEDEQAIREQAYREAIREAIRQKVIDVQDMRDANAATCHELWEKYTVGSDLEVEEAKIEAERLGQELLKVERRVDEAGNEAAVTELGGAASVQKLMTDEAKAISKLKIALQNATAKKEELKR
jgi:hypothetical protein